MNLHFDSFDVGARAITRKNVYFVVLSIDLPRGIFSLCTNNFAQHSDEWNEVSADFRLHKKIHCSRKYANDCCVRNTWGVLFRIKEIRIRWVRESERESWTILSNKIRIKLSCLNVDYFLFWNSLFGFRAYTRAILFFIFFFHLSQATMEHPLQWILLLEGEEGDTASAVAFEVSVTSFRAYSKRILCTHSNGDNGHRSLFMAELGFNIESKLLCSNLFRKWFWDAIYKFGQSFKPHAGTILNSPKTPSRYLFALRCAVLYFVVLCCVALRYVDLLQSRYINVFIHIFCYSSLKQSTRTNDT